MVLVCACSLMTGPAFEAVAGTWRFAAPQQRLFRPLLADPTQTRFAVVTNLDDRLNGDIAGSWEAADYAWDEGSGLRFRTGIHAGVFSRLRWSGTTFPLETADYLVGMHADLGGGRLTGRFEYAHVSAHLADGYDGSAQAMGAMTYSREYFTLYGSYEREARRGGVIGSARAYGSLRWSNHAIPDVRRWRVQAGAELVSSPLTGGATRAYLACDVRVFRDGDLSVNRTAHAGLMFHSGESRGLRFALVYHGGRSEHGQFHRQQDDYAGIGLFFDL
ncbi:MAG: DUF1207 domain-containing protein [Gemmatimonadetes bacterium]|nr:DUF1207 domain-containing protein [Gemmatimonadota bacterium]